MSQPIRVICPKCQAVQSANARQVGSVMTCPDCLEEFVVMAPQEKPTAAPAVRDSPSEDRPDDAASAERLDDPALRRLLHPPFAAAPRQAGEDTETIRLEDELEPAPTRRAVLNRDYEFGLNCPICGTRIDVTDKEVGRRIKCPDCHSPITVREPHPSKRRPKSVLKRPSDAKETTAEDELRLAGTSEEAALPSAYHAIANDLMKKAEAEAAASSESRRRLSSPGDFLRETMERAQAEEDELEKRRRPPLPAGPFRDRILSYLFDPGAIARLMVLGVALFIEVGAIQLAIAAAEGGGLQQFLSILARIFAVGFGVPLAANLAVSMQGILQDTSNGRDTIENWPDLNFLDWLGEALYTFNSLFLCVAPAFACGQVVDWAGGSAGLYWTVVLFVLAAGLMFAFPVVLLSMMEAGSVVVPVSAPVLRSLGLATGRWVQFILLAAAIVGTGLGLAVIRFVWSPAMPINLALAILFVFVTSLYFRFLGRLAWCCEDAVSKADQSRADEPAESELVE